MPRVLIAHEIKAKYAAMNVRQLTTWEAGFISSILGDQILSEKQLSKLEEIYSDLRFGGRFLFADPEETWQDVSYDDVHNFDRD